MPVESIRLTETAVKRLGFAKPGRPYVVRDDSIGGLHLRVSHKEKVFKLKLTVRQDGGRVTRGFTLGKFPKMSAERARREAEDKVRLRDRGELPKESETAPKLTLASSVSDPLALIPGTAKPKAYFEASIDDDREAYDAALAGARARKDDDPSNLRLIDAWILFKDILHTQGKSKLTVGFYQDIVKRHLKEWQPKAKRKVGHFTPLRSITADDVRSLHAKITDTGKKATANQAVITGGAIYTFALKGLRIPGLDPLTPWSGYRLMNKIKARQTGLNSKALAAWYESISKLSPLLRAANEFTLFTGLRLKNFRSLRWSQVSFNEMCIYVDDTKSGVDFKLPLSPPMIEILRRARDASTMIDETNAETFVFASDRSKSGHIMDLKNPNAKNHAKHSAHALRKTWRGIADEVGIPTTHSKILMNHAVPSEVHAEYLTLDSMFDQLRESQNKVSDRILHALASGKSEAEL